MNKVEFLAAAKASPKKWLSNPEVVRRLKLVVATGKSAPDSLTALASTLNACRKAGDVDAFMARLLAAKL